MATPGVDAFASILTNGLLGTGVPLRCWATHAGVVLSEVATASRDLRALDDAGERAGQLLGGLERPGQ